MTDDEKPLKDKRRDPLALPAPKKKLGGRKTRSGLQKGRRTRTGLKHGKKARPTKKKPS